MAKKKPTPVAPVFFEGVAQIIEQARSFVARTADLAMCVTYFEVGRMIVEEEQGGAARAEYGKGLLAALSEYLTGRVGTGFSETNLKNARTFYQVYAPSIRQTPSDELVNGSKKRIRQTASDELDATTSTQIQQAMPVELKNGSKGRKRQTASGELGNGSRDQNSQATLTESGKSQTLFGFLGDKGVPVKSQSMISQFYPFTLSWSHYIILMRVKNDQERRFYEIEATNQQWTVRQLQRQYGSSLYERLALSRNKEEVMRLANEGQRVLKPADMLKNPLILEFLGMDEKAEYTETDLESAIIGKLSQFLLEFGKGFLFEARQKRFTFDEDHFIVDLVFYNRLLQCYVLIDLKTGKLTPQDLGQMQMYVNYFDREVKAEHEKPTVGILLCREKNDRVVRLALPEGSNIYASEYSFYLPDKSLLQRKLVEWTEEFEAENAGRSVSSKK